MPYLRIGRARLVRTLWIASMTPRRYKKTDNPYPSAAPSLTYFDSVLLAGKRTNPGREIVRSRVMFNFAIPDYINSIVSARFVAKVSSWENSFSPTPDSFDAEVHYATADLHLAASITAASFPEFAGTVAYGNTDINTFDLSDAAVFAQRGNYFSLVWANSAEWEDGGARWQGSYQHADVWPSSSAYYPLNPSASTNCLKLQYT
jgi:hypothetical protein